MSSESTVPLYVQCNPLVDLLTDVDEDFLRKHELSKGCAYMYNPQYRHLFDDILSHESLHVAPGGSGLNTARVAQWVWQQVLQQPGHVMFVGCIGKDKYGEQIRSAAEQAGVTMELEVNDDVPTGLCAVCRVGDTRTLIAHSSSAGALSDGFVGSAAAQEGQMAASIMYTTAYANVSRVRQTLQLMSSSRTRTLPNGAKQLSAMGLSNKHVLDDFGEDLVDVLGKLDIIIGNKEEMSDLAMMVQWVPTEMSDAELVLKIATEMMYDQHAVRRVVMTRGSDSILYATSDGEAGEVAVVPLNPGLAKLARTGASDAFAGAFLAGLAARPDNLVYCCRLGAKAATFVINHGIQHLPTDGDSLCEMQP